MKNTTTKIVVMLFSLSIILSACDNNKNIIPSANVTTQERMVSDYTGIEVSTAFTVDVIFSATDEKIEIETNENLHQYVEVDKNGSNLRIKLRDGTNISGNATLKAHIITKNPLSNFLAAEASFIIMTDAVEADEVTISLAGASHFTGTLETTSITVIADGASNASLSGNAGSLLAIANGASLIDDYSFVTQDAEVTLSGASQAKLTVNGNIDLVASGASVFMYKGSGVVRSSELSGGSQIVKVN